MRMLSVLLSRSRLEFWRLKVSLWEGNESIPEMRVWKLGRVKLLMSLGQRNRVRTVSRAVGEICAVVESPPDDRLVVVEERREVQLEGELGDVVPVGSNVTSEAEAHVSRKVAGFGEIDTDDSSGDESDQNSGDAPSKDNSARGDDDAGSVHSSGSNVRHELENLCFLRALRGSEWWGFNPFFCCWQCRFTSQ